MSDPLTQLKALADPARAERDRAYHKVDRPYLGVRVPVVEGLVTEWRAARSIDERVALAAKLWESNIHEARVAAAKLLTQARMRPDDAVWALIASWVPQFDGWALADHACNAGERRLVADPSRLDQVEGWVTAPEMWMRRAALVITLPWTKENNPKPRDLVIRDRVLGWAAAMVDDRDWFIQKAIAWWLRDLSRHDAARTRAFLADYGPRLAAFARREAARHLPAD